MQPFNGFLNTTCQHDRRTALLETARVIEPQKTSHTRLLTSPETVSEQVVPVGVAPQRGAPRVPLRLTAVVSRLTGANVLGAAAAFITGPLLARALGASGRGDLAAIIVPVTLAAYVLGLGLPTYANRELPRGRPVGVVVGSVGALLIAVGAMAALAAVPVADALAGGRGVVRTCLIVGFLCMPLFLLGTLFYSSVAGLQRWRAVIAMRLIPIGVTTVAFVGLSIAGHLTVASAAAFSLLGALLALVPAAPMLTEAGRPVFRAAVAREGLVFGLKTWLGTLALLGNVRLDQFLMITVVSPRELGLYAVAVTLASASSLLITGITPPLFARVSHGESELLPRVLRVSLALTVLLNIGLAVVTPVLLPALFGPEFSDAVPMALILLVAAVPFTGAAVLSAGLQADGAPAISSMAEGIALVVTVAGLAVALGPLGGIGAALVSLASYSASFVFQLVAIHRRHSDTPLHRYVFPTAADVRWARSLV